MWLDALLDVGSLFAIGSIGLAITIGLDVMARRLDIPLDVETRCLDATDHCHRLDDHVDDP